MASINLDFRAGQISAPLEPSIDHKGRINVVVASRREGGEVVATQAAGPLGTGTIGTYRSKVDVNPESDADLPAHASHHLVLATEPGPRYSKVVVDLNANPAIATSVAALDVGDRLSLQSIPAELGRPNSDTLVLGYTEVIGSHSRKITFNSDRGGILSHVGVLDGGADACMQTSGAQMDAAITDTQTALTIATTSGPLFTTSPPAGARIIVRDREVIPVVSISSAAKDTFTRSVSNSWGTPDIDGPWTTSGGTAASYNVNGTKGTIMLPTGDTNSRNVLLPGIYAYTDIISAMSCSQLATGANINGQLRFRNVNASNFYVLNCAFDTTGNVDVSINRVLATVGSTLITVSNAVAYSAGSDIVARVQAVGSTLRGKVWVGASEPDAWTVEFDDPNHAEGQIRVRAVLSGGNTNVNPVLSFDNFEVTNPQLFTVTRDPDQRMAHPQGGNVRTYRAIRTIL